MCIFNIVSPEDKKIAFVTVGRGGGDRPALALLFGDSKGVIWFRTTKGQLIKMDSKTFNNFLTLKKVGFGLYNGGHST